MDGNALDKTTSLGDLAPSLQDREREGATVSPISVLQWTDLLDLETVFVSTDIVVTIGARKKVFQTAMAYRSRREISFALRLSMSKDVNGCFLAMPARLDGKIYAAGQPLDGLMTTFAINRETKFAHRIDWLGINRALVGSIISPAWDTQTGAYVPKEIAAHKPGDLLASVAADFLADCPNIEQLLQADLSSAETIKLAG